MNAVASPASARPHRSHAPRSSSATGPTPGRPRGRSGCDVLELLRLGHRLQLSQALVLDLANALARHVEGAPNLVERARLLAVQSVPELEDASLAGREQPEDARKRLAAHLLVGGQIRRGRVLVGEEVPELGVLVV